MKKYLLIVFLIFVSPLYSQEKMRIAIVDFDAKDIAKTDAAKISELIRNEMVNIDKFVIVERAQMKQILKEQGLQQSGCSDVSCAVEIGKLLSARKILVGSVMEIGEQIIITGRIVDVEKGVAEFSDKAVASNKKEVVTAVSDFVKKLANKINQTPTPETAYIQPEEKPEPKSNNDYSYSSYQNNENKELFGLGAITFSGLSLAAFGTGYYYDMKASDAKSEYDGFASTYNSSTYPPTIASARTDMETAKEDADKYMLYRNIAYGAGGALAIGALYCLYEYFTIDSQTDVSQNSYNSILFCVDMPQFISKENYSFGGSVFLRF